MQSKGARRVYFVSDIHHELRKDKKKSEIDIIPDDSTTTNYLALCGDIGNPFKPNYENFIRRHSGRFKHVFVIAGNHEYYSHRKKRTMIETDEKIRKIASECTNVTFLQTDTFVIDDTMFIGCTLWTEVDDYAKVIMNDYSKIYVATRRQLLKPDDILKLHTTMKKWLATTIDDSTAPQIIVLTHHAPSSLMLGENSKQFERYYSSSCEHLFKPPVIAWISGHTHECVDVRINGIQSVSNCFGYPGQKTNVDVKKYIAI